MVHHQVVAKCAQDGKLHVAPVDQECVLFERSAFDSQEAYDEETKIYTFKVAGNYTVKDKDGTRSMPALEGDTVADPQFIISEHCAVLFGPRKFVGPSDPADPKKHK